LSHQIINDILDSAGHIHAINDIDINNNIIIDNSFYNDSFSITLVYNNNISEDSMKYIYYMDNPLYYSQLNITPPDTDIRLSIWFSDSINDVITSDTFFYFRLHFDYPANLVKPAPQYIVDNLAINCVLVGTHQIMVRNFIVAILRKYNVRKNWAT
jgi:hypothetical protein